MKSNSAQKRHVTVSRMDFPAFLNYAIRKKIGFQTNRVSDSNGKLLVDFVGRFESLHRDFGVITNRLGLHLKLPHKNRYKHIDYTEAYDQETIKLVQNAYYRDIENFGYEFDGS